MAPLPPPFVPQYQRVLEVVASGHAEGQRRTDIEQTVALVVSDVALVEQVVPP